MLTADATAVIQAPSLQVSESPSGPFYEGDLFEWFITVEWVEAPGANAEIESLPPLDNLRIDKRSTRVSSFERDGRRIVQKTFRFLLKTLEAKEANIGGAVVLWDSGETPARVQRLRSDPIWINVSETPSPSRLTYFWLWATILLFAAACVTLFTWNRIRNRDFDQYAHALDPKQARIESAFQEASRRRMEGDPAGFARALSAAVRAQYSCDSDSDDAPLDAMRERVDETVRPIFDRLMKEFRELPYSPERPSNDRLDRIVDDTRRVIEKK